MGTDKSKTVWYCGLSKWGSLESTRFAQAVEALHGCCPVQAICLSARDATIRRHQPHGELPAPTRVGAAEEHQTEDCAASANARASSTRTRPTTDQRINPHLTVLSTCNPPHVASSAGVPPRSAATLSYREFKREICTRQATLEDSKNTALGERTCKPRRAAFRNKRGRLRDMRPFYPVFPVLFPALTGLEEVISAANTGYRELPITT